MNWTNEHWNQSIGNCTEITKQTLTAQLAVCSVYLQIGGNNLFVQHGNGKGKGISSKWSVRWGNPLFLHSIWLETMICLLLEKENYHKFWMNHFINCWLSKSRHSVVWCLLFILIRIITTNIVGTVTISWTSGKFADVAAGHSIDAALDIPWILQKNEFVRCAWDWMWLNGPTWNSKIQIGEFMKW